jgi:hypothetical protein
MVFHGLGAANVLRYPPVMVMVRPMGQSTEMLIHCGRTSTIRGRSGFPLRRRGVLRLPTLPRSAFGFLVWLDVVCRQLHHRAYLRDLAQGPICHGCRRDLALTRRLTPAV